MAVMDVVKYEVNTRELVGKFPSDKIKLGSQLVVYPSQTAFFVKGGAIFDEFTSGTYTIQSENIPLLHKVINAPFGGDTPFTADVWFVNQISILDCLWGTRSPIQIEDPKYHIIVPVTSRGQYGFRIANPRVFLERLVGNMPNFSTERVNEYFRGIIISKLTSIITDSLTRQQKSVVNVNAFVDDISSYAKERLADDFMQYGLELLMFNVIAVSVNENDSSFQRLKGFIDQNAELNILGTDNYRMIRSFGVLDRAAANEGGGFVTSAVGLGAGLGIGANVGQMVGSTLQTNPDIIPPIPTVKYYLAINGERKGPYELNAIANMISSGSIDINTLCWKKPMSNWQPLSTFEEFASINNDEDCPPPIPK